MRTLRNSLLFLTAAAGAFAQQWEIGGNVGGSFLPGVSVSGPMGSATTGFRTGIAAGAWIGQTISRHIGGEVRYNFLLSNLKLDGDGASPTFSGQSHAVYYDVLFHTGGNKESRAQVFGAVGGGMKIFRGTGKEAAFQPLSQFAYLTKTQEVKPMVSFGGGVKFKLAPRMSMRAEVRDFLTPFPKQVIMPAPGAKIGSWLHNIVPMVGISYEY
jgi:hypothetical protein